MTRTAGQQRDDPDRSIFGPKRLATLVSEGPGDRSYVVDGVLTSEDRGVLGGPRWCSKTLLALDLAVSVAAGDRWLARLRAPDPGPVLVFCEPEDLRTAGRRLGAICEDKDIDPEGLDVHLAADRGPSGFSHARIRQLISEIGPRLVIVDPADRVTSRPMSSPEVVANGMRWFTRPCDEAGAALLCVANWDAPGSAEAWSAWASMRLALDRAPRVDHWPAPEDLVLAFDGREGPPRTWEVSSRVFCDDPEVLTSGLHVSLRATSTHPRSYTIRGQRS